MCWGGVVGKVVGNVVGNVVVRVVGNVVVMNCQLCCCHELSGYSIYPVRKMC